MQKDTHFLNFFDNISTYRKNNDNALKFFRLAYKADRRKALVLLFYLRDIQEGAGERAVFRYIIKTLATENYLGTFVDDIIININFITEFGRYDDLITLIEVPKLEPVVIEMIKKQFAKDYQLADGIKRVDSKSDDESEYDYDESDDEEKYKECIEEAEIISAKTKAAQKNISYLAKWMPSVNASSEETKKLGKKLASKLGMTQKEYRKKLATIRSVINIVETKMCAKKIDEIDFSTVPALAMSKYKKVFAKAAPRKFETYVEKVASGEEKINASTLFPYELIKQLNNATDELEAKVIQQQWNSLPDLINNFTAVPVIDSSDSMNSPSIVNDLTCKDLAISLAIYLASRNKGSFKNCVFRYSNEPSLERFEADPKENLKEVYDQLSSFENTGNGNIGMVYDIIFQIVKKLHDNGKPIFLPQALVVFTNKPYITNGPKSKSIMKIIPCEEKHITAFESINENCPKLVFFNLNALEKEEKDISLPLCISILMDATGSMSSYIKKSKENLYTLLAKIEEKTTLSDPITMQYIAYRDICDKKQQIAASGLSTDPKKIKDFIGKIQAFGGGDEPENIAAGFRTAIDKLNSAKKNYQNIFILVADAPNHHPTYVKGYTDNHPKTNELGEKWEKVWENIDSDINALGVTKLFTISCCNRFDVQYKYWEELKCENINRIAEKFSTKENTFDEIFTEKISSSIATGFSFNIFRYLSTLSDGKKSIIDKIITNPRYEDIAISYSQ